MKNINIYKYKKPIRPGTDTKDSHEANEALEA
jgi:hypothetical protein